ERIPDGRAPALGLAALDLVGGGGRAEQEPFAEIGALVTEQHGVELRPNCNRLQQKIADSRVSVTIRNPGGEVRLRGLFPASAATRARYRGRRGLPAPRGLWQRRGARRPSLP